MGRSYFGYEEKYFNKSNNFTVVHNTIWRNVNPPVPGKVSYCDIYFLKCKQKVFPLKRVSSYWTKIACQQVRSWYPGKLLSHINAV